MTEYSDDTLPPGYEDTVKETQAPPRLILLSDAGRPEVDLEHERNVVLGRSSSATVRLRGVRVSRFHARVTLDAAGQCWIEDLQSSNGTYVNEHQVDSRRQLRSGDIIEIDNHALRFRRGHGGRAAEAVHDLALTGTMLQ